MKYGLIVFIGIMAALLSAGSVAAQDDQPDGLIPFECPDFGLDDYSLTCGHVSVPADHMAASEARFLIAVVIVHRNGVEAAADPLVYVNGGPGAKTLAALPLYVNWLDPYLQDRDVILFDARGVGASQPALECPGLDAAFLATAQMDAGEARPTILNAAGACYDALTAAGIDPNLFNSTQIAGDLNVMREELGYSEWNLYGLSYGSRHVLAALRDYPAGIRAAMVDAAVTPEANILSDAPANSQRALAHLSDECHKALLCRAAYPDIVGTFERLRERLDDEPITLTLELEDGSTQHTTLDGVGFSERVIGMLANRAMLPSVPAVIYDAEQGDFAALEDMLTAIAEARMQGGGAMPSTHGQVFSVICGEEAPFNHAAQSESVSLSDFCSVWPVDALGDIENQPVSSDVPTLFGSGSYDSLLRPQYAADAAQRFAQAYVIEAAGQGHGIFNQRGCGSSIGRAFLDNPNQAPDASCFTDAESPKWAITVDVSRPISRIAGVLMLFAGVALVGYASSTLYGMVQSRRIAWRATFKRIGWWPLLMSLVVVFSVYAFAYAIKWEPSPVLFVAIGVPLSTAIQVALVMSSSDEPALEIMLTLPEPFPRLKLSHIAVILMLQGLLALGLTLAIALMEGESIGTGVLNWLAPMLFLSGLAAAISVRTHQAPLAAMMVMMAALGLAIAGDHLLPVKAMQTPWQMPAGAIQPFVWMLHPYLQPESLTWADFLVNRAVVSGLGLVMLAAALAALRDSEKELMAYKGEN